MHETPTARIRMGNTDSPNPTKVERLEIYLKSGQTLKVVCEKYKFTFNTFSGEYDGYFFEGLIEPRRLGLVPSQIAGYTVK